MEKGKSRLIDQTAFFFNWRGILFNLLLNKESHNPAYMLLISHALTALVAFIHIYIVWLEMFAWTTRGRKVFKTFPKELFEPTKALAANQGLYNGFLAAGLIWSFFIMDPVWQVNVRLFFLGCVTVAGIYGAITADKKILIVQSLPAVAAIISILVL